MTVAFSNVRRPTTSFRQRLVRRPRRAEGEARACLCRLARSHFPATPQDLLITAGSDSVIGFPVAEGVNPYLAQKLVSSNSFALFVFHDRSALIAEVVGNDTYQFMPCIMEIPTTALDIESNVKFVFRTIVKDDLLSVVLRPYPSSPSSVPLLSGQDNARYSLDFRENVVLEMTRETDVWGDHLKRILARNAKSSSPVWPAALMHETIASGGPQCLQVKIRELGQLIVSLGKADLPLRIHSGGTMLCQDGLSKREMCITHFDSSAQCHYHEEDSSLLSALEFYIDMEATFVAMAPDRDGPVIRPEDSMVWVIIDEMPSQHELFQLAAKYPKILEI